MSYLVELHSDVDSHAALWTPPSLLVRDNKPANTKQEGEFIRMTLLPGDGFIATRTGMRSVTGSTIRYPVLIRFNIYVRINDGLDRVNDIADNIIDHWQYKTFGKTQTLLASFERIGEQAPRYRAYVDVTAFHDHTHIV